MCQPEEFIKYTRAVSNMNAPEQHIDAQPYVETYPIPWDIMYFRLALNCDFSILNAYANAVYSKTHTQVWHEGLDRYDDAIVHYKHHICHRAEGPAIVYSDGSCEYKYHGLTHRIGGPAIIWMNHSVSWHDMGELHRNDGPALEWFGMFKHWKKRGVLHRENGPAVEWAGGRNEWWFNGERYYEGWPEWLKIFGNKNL
jgi:hypothetical protein